MDSKISLKIIFAIFSIFIVHLFLYYVSPSYGSYFKNVKYDWKKDVISIENSAKTDSIKWVSNYTWSKFIIPDINWWDSNDKNTPIEENIVTNNTESWNETTVDNSDDTSSSDSTIQEVIWLFDDFWLVKKEESQNSSLFGLTNEYPYSYDEYYSRDKKMNFYVFKEKEYKDILNIFDVISYNLFFRIKKVNNFWDKSFYINLDTDLDDNYVRFVFSYKNSNFWLKIKKDWYNEVKKILKGLKIN